jgi:hypothetical protein
MAQAKPLATPRGPPAATWIYFDLKPSIKRIPLIRSRGGGHKKRNMKINTILVKIGREMPSELPLLLLRLQQY